MRTALCLLTLVVGGQGEVEPDPYVTDAETRAAAGYVAVGRIAFADHDSVEVEEALGVGLRWVETEHFRLGVALDAYEAPVDSKEKKKLKAELKALAERIPDLRTSTRKIDPWVRTHLFAARLERLYETFCSDLAVTDEDFAGAEWGQGPYLGQREKFCVLLVEKESAIGRFCSRFGAPPSNDPVRHNFDASGSLFFGLAIEHLFEDGRDDTALECVLSYGVAQHLVAGFRGFQRTVPLWLEEGIGQVYARRADPETVLLPAGARSRGVTEDTWNWPPRVRARVDRDLAPSLGEVLAWQAGSDIDVPELMVVWSKVDYLLQDEPGALGRFLFGVKQPIAGFAGVASPEEQVELVREAWGRSPEELETAWREWVLATYPKK